MTPIMQDGYDAQKKGALDPELVRADTAAGREYREGTRQARRDAFDAEQGHEPFRARPVTAEIFASEPPPVESIAPPADSNAPETDSKPLGGAFSEPEPRAKRRKEKPAPQDQGELFA